VHLGLFLGIGYLMAAFTQRKALHVFIAGTLVVKKVA
jgi:hypothetical protein